ncbi:hypothetical transcript [Echinococcus multilocularis]|uniref:Hypothetical transcript n=1 Tax=Echinococcus multilocularis TaxID=6211 RepID=A0A068XZG9_ECHMU|nr:hypothetical transcript [Echinococcus multilocularis]
MLQREIPAYTNGHWCAICKVPAGVSQPFPLKSHKLIPNFTSISCIRSPPSSVHNDRFSHRHPLRRF